jgi:excisionase family DNA binding protein
MTQLLTGEQVAERLKVPRSTLHAWRHRGDYGPPSVRIGKHVRYPEDKFEQWLAERARESK